MSGLVTFLLFAAAFFFMMRFGCGAQAGHGGHHGGHGDSAKETPPGGRPGLRHARRDRHRVREDASWDPILVLFTPVPRQVRRLAGPVSHSQA